MLTTTIVAPPNNASKWQMGFNSVFKGLIFYRLRKTHGGLQDGRRSRQAMVREGEEGRGNGAERTVVLEEKQRKDEEEERGRRRRGGEMNKEG
jgi:hypothetical protein